MKLYCIDLADRLLIEASQKSTKLRTENGILPMVFDVDPSKRDNEKSGSKLPLVWGKFFSFHVSYRKFILFV